jgi:hypothetical protein
MTARRSIAVAGMCAAALTACTSSHSADPGSGSPTPKRPASTAPDSPAISSNPGTPAGPGRPSDVSAATARLDQQLRAGVATVRTVHLEITTTVSGQTILGTGDEQLKDGTPSALHLTEKMPTGVSLELVLIGTKIYAKLPASLYKTEKPWVLISTHSSTAAIKQLASTIESTRSTASLNSITELIGAATSVRSSGRRSVGAVPTTRYTVVVSPAKLPTAYPGRTELLAAGLTSVPVEIDIDADGRPARVSETVTTGGATVATTITLSQFDQPVSIQPPPADQVGTK